MQFADCGTLMSWNDSKNLYIRNEKIYERILSHVRPDAITEESKNDVEHVARFIFRQAAEGLRYLHEDAKIAHRDIKPDNIMYQTCKADGLSPDTEPDDKALDRVKIGDFTVALELTRDEVRVNDELGTPPFLAPEVLLSDSYLVKPLDMWAFGVSLYAYLFGGALPFNGNTIPEIFDKIRTQNIDWAQLQKDHQFSPECFDLLKGLLEKDPKKRICISEVVIHEWILDL